MHEDVIYSGLDNVLIALNGGKKRKGLPPLSWAYTPENRKKYADAADGGIAGLRTKAPHCYRCTTRHSILCCCEC